jgi:hypothetical protein
MRRLSTDTLAQSTRWMTTRTRQVAAAVASPVSVDVVGVDSAGLPGDSFSGFVELPRLSVL